MNDQEQRDEEQTLDSDEGKDIPFADFAQAGTSADIGIVLLFAQSRPQTQKRHVVGQVMLPMKVAADTTMMLLRQIVEVEKSTGRKYLPDNIQVTEQPRQT